MEIVLDFESDWIAILRQDLMSAGYLIDSADDFERLSIKFFNARKRRLEPTARRVLAASEFTCPPDLEGGFRLFRERAEQGADLAPHQSKRLLDADFNDYLLNDWGIHHFHLGVSPDPEAPSFIARTPQLLFARVTQHAIFLLDIVDHQAWSQQRFLQILHSNWPESIQDYRLKDVIAVERSVSDDEVAQLRKAGIQTMIQVAPGAVYAPIGGGYSASGDSTEAVLATLSCKRWLRKLEDNVRANASEYLDQIRERGLEPADPPRFRLALDAGGSYALEEGARVAILLTRWSPR